MTAPTDLYYSMVKRILKKRPTKNTSRLIVVSEIQLSLNKDWRGFMALRRLFFMGGATAAINVRRLQQRRDGVGKRRCYPYWKRPFFLFHIR